MPALQAFNGDSAADLASRVPFSTKTSIDVLHTQYMESNKPDKLDNVESVSSKDSTWGLHEAVTEVDSRDAATPDKWVPRHPRLVRLTGRHPFNCEPPLPDLMERGFITPTALRKQPNPLSMAVCPAAGGSRASQLHMSCRVCQKPRCSSEAGMGCSQGFCNWTG